MLALGLPPVSANVTSAVGLVSGYLGGSLSYRQELQGQGSRMGQLLLPVIIGSILGAALLLVTPQETFNAIVPYLILTACLLLAAQPYIKRLVQTAGKQETGPASQVGLATQTVGLATRLGIGIAAVYGTYFGAGLGVILLAVLGALVVDGLQRLNGLRSALSLSIKVIGVLIFLFSGQVAWLPALTLFVSAYGGGVLGAVVCRRMSEAVLRYTVIACGLIVVALLLLA